MTKASETSYLTDIAEDKFKPGTISHKRGNPIEGINTLVAIFFDFIILDSCSFFALISMPLI